MTATQPARRRRLGELLIDAGVLDESRLKAALGEQKKWGGKLGRCLIEMGFVDEDSMMRALSRQLNLQTIDLDHAPLPATVAQLLRVDLCERYGVFPLGGDPKTRTLQLASSDPTNHESTQELSLATNSRITLTVATGSAIDRAIRRYYYGEGAGSPRPAGAGPEIVPSKSVAAAPPPPPASANLELDELLGNAPLRPTNPKQPAITTPPPPAAVADDSALKKEIAMLKEQLDSLEKVTASQVRALRGLVELLIESGLMSRDEYLVKVHKPD